MLRQEVEVLEVADDELKAVVRKDIGEVPFAPRAQVVVDLDARVRVGKEPRDEVAAEETSPSGDDVPSHRPSVTIGCRPAWDGSLR